MSTHDQVRLSAEQLNALDTAVANILALDDATFAAELVKHAEGDIARFVLDMGVLRAGALEAGFTPTFGDGTVARFNLEPTRLVLPITNVNFKLGDIYLEPAFELLQVPSKSLVEGFEISMPAGTTRENPVSYTSAQEKAGEYFALGSELSRAA